MRLRSGLSDKLYFNLGSLGGPKHLLWLLRLALLLLLLGRLYEAFYFSNYYNEQWLAVALLALGFPLVVVPQRLGKHVQYLLTGAAFAVLSWRFWLAFSGSGYQWPNLLEHLAQWLLPVLLLLKLRKSHYFWLAVKVAVSATFIGHGCYALGIPAVPSSFLWLTSVGFATDEAAARVLLQIFGQADLIAVLLLWLPWRASQTLAIIYMITWGLLTALSRLYVPLIDENTESVLLRWGFEFLVRTPHFLLPLVLLYRVAKKSAKY